MKTERTKTLILKWLCKQFGYENYEHDFRDEWLSYTIWDRILSIRFDKRVESSNGLVKLIPECFMGTIQYQTLKGVNEDSFYLDLNTILHLKYPKIVSQKILKTDVIKEQGEPDEYRYTWEVLLEDGTTIIERTHRKDMGLEYRDIIYDLRIQERTFIEFLSKTTQPNGK